ncbi:MAG: hypothetical protein DI543_24275, partial [Bradyrhizobium icense]
MIIRRLIAPLAVAVVTFHAAEAGAQGAFPAPLPNQPANASPFPPVGGGAPAQSSPFPPVGGGQAAAPAPSAFP